MNRTIARRAFLKASAYAILAAPLAAEAQQREKVPRIGVLTVHTVSSAAAVKNIGAFRQGLRDLGYVEGQNIVIEYRWGEGQVERLSGLAAELVHLKVNLIVAAGTQASQAAQHATDTIPIVIESSDPVGTGLVVSLARPGGNITGLSLLNPELSGKRLELLKEVVPGLSRVAILWHGGHQGAILAMQETEAASGVLGMQPQSLEVRGPADFERSFEAATTEGTKVLIVLSSALFVAERRRLVELVTKSRLAAMFPYREDAEAGGLMSYGPSVPDAYRHAAYYVNRILKGAKPADSLSSSPRNTNWSSTQKRPRRWASPFRRHYCSGLIR